MLSKYQKGLTVEERLYYLALWVEVHLLPYLGERAIDRELWEERKKWDEIELKH